MAEKQRSDNAVPVEVHRLENDYRRAFADVPELLKQAQEALRAVPTSTGVSGVIVRTYTTYSAYDDPIED